MRGGIFSATTSVADALDEIKSEDTMSGRDLASTVTQERMVELAPLGDDRGLKLAIIDTGIKDSIVTKLRERGVSVELHPCTVTAEELKARDVNGYFLANGPGDPAALDSIVQSVRGLIGHRPVFGICLGHQLLCRAVGLETWKLPFGHRGANHPVKDLVEGRVEITSQNHGFAVMGPGGAERVEVDEPVRWETDFGHAELTHVNLYDRTVEGLALPEAGCATVQYHPEAGPGPHDAEHIFDRFIRGLEEAA
jgi:carbamoyl-phosphate synthase small subunit